LPGGIFRSFSSAWPSHFAFYEICGSQKTKGSHF
jgi:hypothetical protein